MQGDEKPATPLVTGARRRILFVSEAISLAQVVRLATLARSLDPLRYEVHFACARFDPLVFEGCGFTRHPLYSLEAARVLRAFDVGGRLYERRTLERYLGADLEVIDRVRPHLVVGDFRWSLAVSAPLRHVPLCTLINAYWSPHAVRERFPLPDHPIIKAIGEPLAQRCFPRALPKAFAYFAKPLNALRKAHGLAPVGSLQEVLTHGDVTIYPDTPALVPTRRLPPSHRYIGPVLWSPEVRLPEAWRTPPSGRTRIYVTLGSSGRVDVLHDVLAGLADLDVEVLVATAGRLAPWRMRRDVHVVDYAPGDRAAACAALVICNGGSSTAYQALARGVPVLGLPSNLDQFLAMQAIVERGAGLLLAARDVQPARVRRAVVELLERPERRQAASEIARDFAAWDSSACFERIVRATHRDQMSR